MREIRRLPEMYLFAQKAKSHGKKIGLVPTMGALHEGHLSLVAEAKKRAEVVVVSIFINPIQFGPGEDFTHYPRGLKKDKKLLKNFEVDVLFLPEASAMFPKGFKTYVEVEGLSKKMCGRSRPAHFRGVATVVAKLLNTACPDLVFFGQKDYQQQVIIKQMIRDLDFPTEMVALPTVREFDGLAMSSRNAYLSPRERKSAVILYKALSLAKKEVEKGEKDLKKIVFRMRSLIGTEPKARLDYLVAADPENLNEVSRLKGRILFALAAYVGKARLIDNMVISAD